MRLELERAQRKYGQSLCCNPPLRVSPPSGICSTPPALCYFCYTPDYCLYVPGVRTQAQCEQQVGVCQLRNGTQGLVTGPSFDVVQALCANFTSCSFCAVPGGCQTRAQCLAPQSA